MVSVSCWFSGQCLALVCDQSPVVVIVISVVLSVSCRGQCVMLR